jgi:lysyl-tRNA synthetase class 2
MDIQFDLPNKSAWLDLLFTHLVEPTMGNNLCVVYEYPACQAALARKTVNFHGYEVARRFEVYWRGLELANGYWELCDAGEQLARFEQDLAKREVAGKLSVEIDNNLMAALEYGLPCCAGVALGVDRLLMCLTGENDIKAVQFFSPLD